VFAEIESKALLPLPAVPYEVVLWKKARVHRDAHIQFDGRLYSVPCRYLEQDVWGKATPSIVNAIAVDEPGATHDRRGAHYRSTLVNHLTVHRGELRHRSGAYWEEREAKISVDVDSHVGGIFDSDAGLSPLRALQSVVTPLEPAP